MFILNQSTSSDFLSRFYAFNDAVIRKIEISYLSNGQRNISILIATRDAQESQNNGWVCVRLVMSQVEDFCFSDAAKFTAQVLSQGIHICWFEKNVGIDFGHYVDQPTDRAELTRSRFFAISSSVDWGVESY
jgi:hypothetical protein